MARPFKTTGIYILSGMNPCAYHCRYCQLTTTKPTKNITMDRFKAIVNRFIDYKHFNHLKDFDVDFWNGYTYDCSLIDFQKELDLHKKVGDWELKILLLGGMPHMEDATLKQWFQDRKHIGSEFVAATYLGCKDQHDYWNNKKGNFEFLIKAQKMASAVGLDNVQRLLLTRSSLYRMEELLDVLDSLEIPIKERSAYPFFYSGFARRYEDERVTLSLLENQSERIKSIYRKDKETWKSEQEWTEYARTTRHKYEEGSIHLVLTDENIEHIESMSCEAILDDLTNRTQKAYAMVPSQEELAENYADRTSEKIYMFLWDMECLWLDRYLKEHPLQGFERALTHFGR